MIPGPRGLKVPSHYLFVDDVMIFCRGDRGTTDSLIKLFSKYAAFSCQILNTHKSFIFVGSVSEARLHHISNQLDFKIGHLPLSYLGVPIIKGKPKVIYLTPVMDKVKAKLSKLKGSLLSFAGRIQMVKYYIILYACS